MNRFLRNFWDTEAARAFLCVPVVMTGVALPLDFIFQIDLYIKYLRLAELPMVYAWGWIFYATIGLAMALMSILPIMGLARLLRRRPIIWAARFGAWLALSVVIIVLLRGAKLWLEVGDFALAGWMARFKWEIALACAVCSAISIYIARSSRLPAGLSSLAGAVMGAGLMVTVLAVAAESFATVLSQMSAQAKGGPAAADKRRPNIVLITIDALAADHMSLYGYQRPTTPNLDDLARQATVFDRFYANSNWTTPAVSSLIHGVRPWTHGAVRIDAQPDSEFARKGLVARLKSAGYYTIAVAANIRAAPHFIRANPWFDDIVDGRASQTFPIAVTRHASAMSAMRMDIVTQTYTWVDLSLKFIGDRSRNDHFDPELAMSAARDLIQGRNPNRPMFLWVHLFPPHDPYATPAPFLGMFDTAPTARTRFDSTPLDHFLANSDPTFPKRLIGRYDESIAYVDHHMGKFIEWLKARGLFEDSLLVISADHGESFVKGYGHHRGPLLHDALIRIPLIIKEPVQGNGERLSVLAEQIDLMPTLLDLAGVRVPERVEGRSLRPAIRGEPMSGAVFSMNFEQSNGIGKLDVGTVAMIEGRWKYVHYFGPMTYPKMPKLEDSLYDLQADPDENTSLIEVQSNVTKRMVDEIITRLTQHGGPLP